MNKILVASSESVHQGAFKLTQKVDYGLYLLASLAMADGEPKSIQVIADKHHLSFAFLQKIAGLLKGAGLIKAIRGKAGGYLLAKSPEEISFKEIIEALEGPVRVMRCIDTSSQCKRQSSCKIQFGLQKINQEIINTLTKKTLSFFLS